MQENASPILKRDDDLGMSEAFGRDTILHETVRGLIKKHGIYQVVETGVWRGYTTRAFAGMVELVTGIEIDPTMHAEASSTTFDIFSVFVHLGDSAKALPNLIGTGKILFYLDAHWLENWPLFDELDAIVDYGKPCVIVIHDAQVPDHPELGFDSYAGQALTFELVKPYLDRLPWKWSHSFNSEAEGHKRGVLFIEPDSVELDYHPV